jgi:lipopolysaccharide biosynthesis glycosyltransferase
MSMRQAVERGGVLVAPNHLKARPRFGPVVLAADSNYAMQLATTLRSLVDSNVRAWPIDVHVFWEGSAETRGRVVASLPEGAATIRWLPVDLGLFDGFSVPPGLSPMAFARILIPRVFAAEVERVLYLDADMLVLDDLESLWSLDLEGRVAGAVADVPLRCARDGTDSRWERPATSGDPAVAGVLDYCRRQLPRVPRVADYFNSGMLLIDLPRWRAERISERALEYLARNPQSPFGDQDALNVGCDGRWMPLDRRWNDQDHLLVTVDDLPPSERPAIVHFITTNKPWLAKALSRNAGLWDRYRSRTSFARTTSERIGAACFMGLRASRRAMSRLALVRAIRRSLGRRHQRDAGTERRSTSGDVE